MFRWSILFVCLIFDFSLGKQYIIKSGAATGSKESSFTKQETEDYGIRNKGQFFNGFIQENTDCNGHSSLYFDNVGEVRGKVEQRIVDCEDGMKFRDPTDDPIVTTANNQPTNDQTTTSTTTTTTTLPEPETTATPDKGDYKPIFECKDGVGISLDEDLATCEDGKKMTLDCANRSLVDNKIYCCPECPKVDLDPNLLKDCYPFCDKKPDPVIQNASKKNGEYKPIFQCKEGVGILSSGKFHVTCDDGEEMKIDCEIPQRADNKVYCCPECPKKKGPKGKFRSGFNPWKRGSRRSKNNNGICTDKLGRIYNMAKERDVQVVADGANAQMEELNDSGVADEERGKAVDIKERG